MGGGCKTHGLLRHEPGLLGKILKGVATLVMECICNVRIDSSFGTTLDPEIPITTPEQPPKFARNFHHIFGTAAVGLAPVDDIEVLLSYYLSRN